MPVKSKAQARKFASMLNEKKITKKVFQEWTHGVNQAKLPERVGPAKDKPALRDKLWRKK